MKTSCGVLQLKRLLVLLMVSMWNLQIFPQDPVLKVPEKIYLQLPSKTYTPNQTVWFKAIVTNAQTHAPSYFSGTLYVDLIGPKGTVLEHKMVKLNKGIGYGGFDLQNATEGQLFLRAYTEWSRNFGEDHFFKTDIGNYPINDEKEDVFQDLKLVQKEGEEPTLVGALHLEEANGWPKNKMKLHLNWATGKDTIEVKRNKDDPYNFQYQLAEETPWVEVGLPRIDNQNHTKTLILNEGFLDLQFFPESGKMIHGFFQKIAFKAVGVDGNGVATKGHIFDDKGNKIAPFKSNALGMGVCYLKANKNRSYHAKIISEDKLLGNMEFSLPEVYASGNILSVKKSGNKIRFTVRSNILEGKVGIKASSRGMDYFLVEGNLRNGKLVSELPSENFPNGIIVFTVLDKEQNPVAERLFFNPSEEELLGIQLKTAKEAFTKREETKLDIQITKSEEDVGQANVSTLVLNKNQWNGQLNGSILSYFLLESELKGRIENPGYYFDKNNPDRFKDLDALLLTQGWRNYKYVDKPLDKIDFWPEKGLTLNGRIGTKAKKKFDAPLDLTLSTFGNETIIYTATSDSLGNFQFVLEDSYGKDMPILLHANGNEKKKKSLKVSLSDKSRPKINYAHNPFSYKMDTVTKVMLDNQRKLERVEMVFDSLYGVTQLDEVVVEDVRLDPERKKIYDRYGEPDVIISGDSIAKKEKKWSYGLYSVLLFNYPEEIIIERFPDGFMLAHVAPTSEPTLLMVDGRLITQHEYGLVPHMPPSIIKDIELIKFAERFKMSYFEVFPETHPLALPVTGHIISINTKGGVGIHATDKPLPGTLKTSIKVFSPIKEFYKPKYDKPIPIDEQKPDLRSLIHWNPNLTTDLAGKVSDSFYNGDVTGDFVIIIEAIAADGRIGYQTKTFSVTE